MTRTNIRKPPLLSASTPCKAGRRRREAPPLPPHRGEERGPEAVEKLGPNCALSVLELCPNCAKAVSFKGSALPFSVPKPNGFGTFLLPQSLVSALRKTFFGPFFCPKGYTLSAYTLYPFAQNTTTPSNDHPPVCGPKHYYPFGQNTTTPFSEDRALKGPSAPPRHGRWGTPSPLSAPMKALCRKRPTAAASPRSFSSTALRRSPRKPLRSHPQHSLFRRPKGKDWKERLTTMYQLTAIHQTAPEERGRKTLQKKSFGQSRKTLYLCKLFAECIVVVRFIPVHGGDTSQGNLPTHPKRLPRPLSVSEPQKRRKGAREQKIL